MVDRQDTEYTVTEQCGLLGISRSGVYYVPTVSERKIEIMNYMDEIYTDIKLPICLHYAFYFRGEHG